jgi:Bacterial mobilisation protein (MobC)
MAGNPCIQCRVSYEVKARLHAIAEERGVTESALLKKFVDIALLQSAGTLDSNLGPKVEAAPRNARLFVRTRPDDHVLLRERAAARGMAAATYASIVLRTHLRGVARIPDREFAELKRTVAELGAIGRNLNQIARVANTAGQVTGPNRQDLQAILRACTALRDHVKELIRANAASWDT